MAQVRMEDIVDHLRPAMRSALKDAVEEVVRDAKFDEQELFRAFRRKVARKCGTWAKVPDDYVKAT